MLKLLKKEVLLEEKRIKDKLVKLRNDAKTKLSNKLGEKKAKQNGYEISKNDYDEIFKKVCVDAYDKTIRKDDDKEENAGYQIESRKTFGDARDWKEEESIRSSDIVINNTNDALPKDYKYDFSETRLGRDLLRRLTPEGWEEQAKKQGFTYSEDSYNNAIKQEFAYEMKCNGHINDYYHYCHDVGVHDF